MVDLTGWNLRNWHDDDRRFAETVTGRAIKRHQAIFEECLACDSLKRNRILRKEFEGVANFLRQSLRILEILQAYQATTGRIGGKQGVAKLLHLTRPGLYFQMNELGLKPGDFQGDAQIGALLRKSKATRNIVRQLYPADKTEELIADTAKPVGVEGVEPPLAPEAPPPTPEQSWAVRIESPSPDANIKPYTIQSP